MASSISVVFEYYIHLPFETSWPGIARRFMINLPYMVLISLIELVSHLIIMLLFIFCYSRASLVVLVLGDDSSSDINSMYLHGTKMVGYPSDISLPCVNVSVWLTFAVTSELALPCQLFHYLCTCFLAGHYRTLCLFKVGCSLYLNFWNSRFHDIYLTISVVVIDQGNLPYMPVHGSFSC